ncbi:CORVET complex subunit VPS3 [Sugiyamaella lignohabitans]|uniref:CORVET complex subunit VPS3 n=1 Tax=Sugiyamaella lignohabitans TaxID=796027 RepID=A0A167BZK9_9ASCO|nr:CORVET complex subunit VPS3 [Sugiyamaella lignohabitans]ANB11024.1 CORVET complex subunit VPS3 [Sugiyamaella lignohabitans]
MESDPYIIASKQRTHSKKRRPVSQIVILPTISRALVLSQSTTSVFTLPEFAPCSNVGSMRDVNALSRDIDDFTVLNERGDSEFAEVTVFSKSAIRLVKVFGESLKLAGNIEYPGVLNGVRRSSYALVVNNESYDLLDLKHVRKVPLFPLRAAGEDEDQDSETREEDTYAQKQPGTTTETAGTEGETNASPTVEQSAETEPVGTTLTNKQVPEIAKEEGDDSKTGTEESKTITETSAQSTTEEVDKAKDELTEPGSEADKKSNVETDPTNTIKVEEDAGMEVSVDSTTEVTTEPSTQPAPEVKVGETATSEGSTTEPSTQVATELKIGGTATTEGSHIQRPRAGKGHAPAVSIHSIQSTGSVESAESKPSSSPVSTTSATFPSMEGVPTPTTEVEGSKSDHSATGKSKSKKHADPIKPIIVPVASDEFLVTSGTSAVDRAMGLVVNVDGEISRGTIAWSKYPSSVAVDYPYVAAVIDNQVQLHSLHDQKLVQTVEFPSKPLVTTVLAPYKTPYTVLVNKIVLAPLAVEDIKSPDVVSRMSSERDTACKISICSSTLFAYTPEAGVECLIPTPRFLSLEKLVLVNGQVDDVYDEIERMDFSTELAVTQLQYLNLLIGLYYLREANHTPSHFSDVTKTWLVASLDPRIMIFIFDKKNVKGEVWVFNGVISFIETLQKTYSSSMSKLSENVVSFLKTFYKDWFKKREMASLGLADKENVFKSLELSYLAFLLKCEEKSKASQHDLIHAIDNEIVLATDESIELLRQQKKFFYLSHMYNKLKMPSELLSCWKEMLLETNPAFANGETTMAEYLINECEDEGLVWDYGAWLVQTYPKTGIKVFTSPDLRVNINENQVVAVLKSMNNDEAWRQYLKFLVYEKNQTLFASDLATVMLLDIVDKISKNPDVRKSLMDNYDIYKALPVPKPAYIPFLRNKLQNSQPVVPTKSKGLLLKSTIAAPAASLSPFEEVMKMRLELMELVDSTSDFDYTSLMHLSQDEPDTLLIEQCVVFGHLGIHEQCLDILCNRLTDYKTAIDYCIYGRIPISMTILEPLDSQIQKDLFRQLFLRYLKVPDPGTRIACTRILLEQWGNRLDVSLVLSNLPDNWPVEVVSGYLSQFFKRTMADQNQASVDRSLARSENLFISQQLLELSKIAYTPSDI